MWHSERIIIYYHCINHSYKLLKNTVVGHKMFSFNGIDFAIIVPVNNFVLYTLKETCEVSTWTHCRTLADPHVDKRFQWKENVYRYCSNNIVLNVSCYPYNIKYYFLYTIYIKKVVTGQNSANKYSILQKWYYVYMKNLE